MKKLSILVGLIIGLVFVSVANAQTKITFAKGTSEKTLTITVAAGKENKYSLAVKEGQVINVGIEGDIQVSKKVEFPVITLNSVNDVENVDQTQDGEAYYSLLAGRNGKYIITVSSGAKESRTFKLEVKVSDNKEDFQGGEEVDQ